MSEGNTYVEKKPKNPITYQNKDVVSKIFGENLKEKSLAVYGVNIPKIKEVLPTNLPVIEANEMRLDIGCLQFTVEEVFLSELNGTEIEDTLTDKIRSTGILNEEEQMQFVILPLIYAGKKEKQECIRRCFELAKEIKFPEMQIFLLSGLLVFTDKVIEQEDSESIRRWIKMTKVGRLFEEEKLEALRKLEKEKEQEKKEAIKEAKRETAKQTAKQTACRMLKGGIPIAEIQKFITNLSYEEIAALNKS